jgi:hypothetical protein
MELRSWLDVTKSKAYKSLNADEKRAAKLQYPGIIIKSWSEVVNSEEYKGLTDKQQRDAKKQYLHDISQDNGLKFLANSVNKNTLDIKKVIEGLGSKISIIKIPEIKLPDVELNTNSLKDILDDLAFQISNISIESDKKITDWDFKFIRDKEGYITGIKAHGETDT